MNTATLPQSYSRPSFQALPFQKEPTDLERLAEMCVRTVEGDIHSDTRLYENSFHSLQNVFFATKGGLFYAAKSITEVEEPRIKIITGFYIEKARSAETDGPSSAAQMTKFFKDLGINCNLVTDTYCAPVCAAALQAVGCEDLLEVVPDNRETVKKVRHQWEDSEVSHVIAIERPAPSRRTGICKNMVNEQIIHCAPLHLLLNSRRYITIGVGDRGNEAGCGNLDITALVAQDHVLIPYAEDIHTNVKSNLLITSRVSNWAANALIAAMGIVQTGDWRDAACNALCPSVEAKILQSMSKAGAVDGITHKNDFDNITIDSLPLNVNLEMTAKIKTSIDAMNMHEDIHLRRYLQHPAYRANGGAHISAICG